MTAFAPEQYKETLIFLTTAGVVVPLFRRLKISPILGFLGAGVLLGPYGAGALADRVNWLALSRWAMSSKSRPSRNSASSFSCS